ncbi:MAG: AAA family ATPase [Phycisphaerae bacterium]|nr:AAA family ATPase [Phycisphaerae bacterium]
MNDLNTYSNHLVEEEAAGFETPAGASGLSMAGFVIEIFRRWYIVLPTFLVLCLVGIPAIWFLKVPVYEVTGAIRVAPILTDILSGEADEGEILNYQNFVNTEAVRITSGPAVQRVADDLVDKNMAFFENGSVNVAEGLKQTLSGSKTRPEPVRILKKAISERTIRATAERRSELITITMESKNVEEAKQIVDAFIRAYMAIEVSNSADVENQKLSLLENERQVLSQKMQNQRKTISQLAQEFGDKDLESRRDMKLERVSSLLAQVTQYEVRRINLEAMVQLLEKTDEEQTIGPEELLQMRNEYINSDHVIRAFAGNITQLEQELVAIRQVLTPSNPELKNKIELVETLKERVAQLKEESGQTFDELMAEKMAKAGKERLAKAQAELEQIRAYEERFRELLAKEDTETIGVGRTQVAIQDLEDELALTKETYDTVSRRIKELEMQRKRPARISVAYNADVALVKDKRVKLTIALIFGALAFGMLLSFMAAKADKRLRTPEDVVRRIGGRMLGTTPGLGYFDKTLLQGRLAEDYQIIYANLGLLNDESEGMPRRLIVTSAGPQEGKTTFAINLATSIARSGKKVLLIDGDLRKPDIARILNIPKGTSSLQGVFLGGELKKYIYHIPSIGLDVLAGDFDDSSQDSHAYELLVALHKGRYIDKISQEYDHVVIDTPPALTFPDALIWARIAGAVILTSFAGRTTAPDLKEVKVRLARLNVTILGTVLSNVRISRGYYRYAYNYRSQNGQYQAKAKVKRTDTKQFLLSMQEPDK